MSEIVVAKCIIAGAFVREGVFIDSREELEEGKIYRMKRCRYNRYVMANDDSSCPPKYFTERFEIIEEVKEVITTTDSYEG